MAGSGGLAVVLAGGSGRRFGADKLGQQLSEAPTVLDAALAGLPADVEIVVVGPERATVRPVRFVREDPAGGGPAAGMVAGLRVAAERRPALVAVLPGDGPGAGRAAVALLAVLQREPGVAAVVAEEPGGREQPLQLALRPAAVAQLCARQETDGLSARELLRDLDPPPRPVPLAAELLFDIDTPGQLAAWQARSSPAVAELVRLVEQRRRADGRPVVLALDGRSGSGKSTLAAALRLVTEATVLPGDHFYAPAFAAARVADLAALTDAEVADRVFDWRRLRAEALEPLAAGGSARYRPFDWGGSPSPDGLGTSRGVPAAPVVVLEGVYAARPELADLVTASVLVTVDEPTRTARLAGRGDEPARAELWRRGERWYFDEVRTAADVDLVVDGSAGRLGR